MEFPRLVYKGPATHVLVHNAEEYEKAMAAGWFGSVPEASGQKPAAVAPKVAPKEDLGQAAPPVVTETTAAAAPAPALSKKEQKAMAKAQQAAQTSQNAADASAGTTKQPWD